MERDIVDGLEGLAAIENYALLSAPDKVEIDWKAIQATYMGDAYIARFMDHSGLTSLMETRLRSEI
jgi:hypothetical protein